MIRQAARNGVLVGGLVAILVIAITQIPVLATGYPFALLPFLAAGPVAVPSRRFRLWLVPVAGFLAGLIAALIGVGTMVLAGQVLASRLWGLVGAATYPPMPPLPRPDFLPVVTWPQELLLIGVPVFSALWALVYGIVFASERGGIAGTIEHNLAILRASIESKLVFLLLALVGVSAVIGWVAFATMEDIHLKGHRTQLYLDWIEHSNQISSAIDATVAASSIPDPAERQRRVREQLTSLSQTLEHLDKPPLHPGIAVSADALAQFASRYRQQTTQIREHAARLLTAAEDNKSPDIVRLIAVREASIGAHRAHAQLADQIEDDTRALVESSDLQHHASLMTLLALVVFAGLAGLVLGQASGGTIKRPLVEIEHQLDRIAGADFSTRIVIPNRDELGDLAIRINGVTRELDRLYAVEREGRTMAESLAENERELNSARQFWAHAIVHDLKAPITVASGYLELLLFGRYGKLTAEQSAAIREADDSLKRLSNRTRDIVDLFRLEEASVPIDQEIIDPRTLVDNAARASRNPDRQPITVTGESSLTPVPCDPRLILRIFENLTSNAYKHGGPRVQVTLSAREIGDSIVFSVDDSGPGIASDDRERVFQLFQRAEGGSRHGTGLGLTFCKVVIERHGGRIWIEDGPGGGTRVSFTLPTVMAALDIAA